MAKMTTKQLRAMQADGARIVCESPGYRGRTVFYSPRNANDPSPWRLAGDLATSGYRFSGAECSARRKA